MSKRFIFSSESVGEGHPDKVCDTISDAVLDACLTQDKYSRVACECYAKSNIVVVGGEITTKAELDYVKIAREAIRGIGYVNDDDVFHADRVFVMNIVTRQSPDIAQGVDARAAKGKKKAEQGAGDQGLMFGYASNETESLMPAPICYAHRLVERQAEVRKSNLLPWLRPDAKSQVSCRYVDGKVVGLDAVVLSTQHGPDVKQEDLREAVMELIIKHVLPKEWLGRDTKFHINPTGNFVIGGPVGDCGLTGRKIIVDSYGGMARHGGGAFSGKDPSKVDRSAAYAARYVAKNLVAAGLADRCEIQVSYAIGVAEPTSITVETFGTGRLDQDRLEQLVRAHFDLRPYGIVKMLDLVHPMYRRTAAYGHFGREPVHMTYKWEEQIGDKKVEKSEAFTAFTWEKTDKAEALRKDAGL